MGRLYLVRHGQASLLADDYDALSDHGKEQSRILGRWFSARGKRFDHAVSGGLRRQRETAQECLEAMDIDPSRLLIDEDFEEYSNEGIFACYRPDLTDPAAMGAYLRSHKNPRREFQNMFAEALGRWLSGRHDADYPMTWGEFRARNVAALERVNERCGSGESAVVFTSAGVIASICQHLLAVPDSHLPELHFAFFNASVTRVLSQPGKMGLSYFNNVAHLEVAETPDRKLVTYR